MNAKTSIAEHFKTHDISYEAFEHEPFFTVEETLGAYEKMGIPENKSLFLRDKKKKNFYLVVIEGTKTVNIKDLTARFEEKSLGFCSEGYLESMLHTYSGAVSPFGLIFSEAENIEVLFDQDLLENKFNHLGFHPNENTDTWKLSTADFKRFLETLPQKITINRL